MHGTRYIARPWQACLTDRQASISLLTAATIAVLFAFAAIAVDASNLYYQRRAQQGANDLAAIAAVASLDNATNAALANIRSNGFQNSNLTALALGVYSPDAATAPANRFSAPGSGSQNAARLTMRQTVPTFLGGIFALFNGNSSSGIMSADITTQAVAAKTAFTSFSIGTRLLRLDNGIINSVLGAMLGSSISLSAMDYQALIDADIDMFRFLNALATRASLTGITYSQLTSGSVRVGDALGASLDSAQAGSQSAAAISALTTIVNALGGMSQNISVASLANLGPYANMSVGSAGSLTATVNALDMISAIAQLANGTHQVETSLNANLPGILSTTLKLAIGERPVNSGLVQLGATGVSTHTAQTRMLLNMQLTVPGQVFTLNVPLYVEIAQGTARFATLNCNPWSMSSATVTLGVTPGVVDAWIGNVTDTMLTNFVSSPNPSAATLATVSSLVSVSGRAHATISNTSETMVTYSYDEILNATKKTTSTTDYTASLMASLLSDLQLNVNVIGLGLGLPSGLTGIVSSALAGQLANIDLVIASVLTALGVEIGSADTWVTGLSCGNAVLVN